MADDAMHPPSARRRARAHRAGLHAASPWLVGAAVAAVFALAAEHALRGAARELGDAVAAACRTEAELFPRAVTTRVLAVALPLAIAMALIAIIAHVAQSRRFVMPRRRVDDAPHLPARRGANALAAASAGVAIAIVTLVWLWRAAPSLGAQLAQPSATVAVHTVIAALAALAIAWLVLAVGDAVARHRALASTLRMTAQQQREDARHDAADPRWRKLRARLAGDPARIAIGGATLLVVGDDAAVAIAWHPHREPVPRRVAHGRGIEATRLIALARRNQLPIHRDAELAAQLAGGRAAVPESAWPRLAEVVAAVVSARE